MALCTFPMDYSSQAALRESIVSFHCVRYTELYVPHYEGNHEGETHMTVDISDIENIIHQQNTWRQTQTINLIASENTPSEAVRLPTAS